jgi:hypothetical protein
MRRKWSLHWKWYDLWIGAFYERSTKTWYICLLPTLVIKGEIE